MKCLNNRAESHLTGLVERDSEAGGAGAWVNQGFCDTALPIPRVVSSTAYSPNPLFQEKLESVGPPPEAPPLPPTGLGGGRKRRGCCSLIKGQELQNRPGP